MDVLKYNKEKWNKQVESGNPWTIPVSAEVIAEARKGNFNVLLTEQKPVPRDWFPDSFKGLKMLCLACGGGQQGPVFAALGAEVTILDNSPRQLEQDRKVAEREGLNIRTVEGDMRDLSVFTDESFDLVFHPVSNCFIPEVRPVWKESYRVLKRKGFLLSGFTNPFMYMFDWRKADEGIFKVRHKLPFDSRTLSPEDLKYEYGDEMPVEFSHSLEEQIGGQLVAGFLLQAMYEDTQPTPLGEYMPCYIATCAVKP
ncbi:MAG: class I SAM-dependent methyltransferase [Spirochaetales bacterium]|nr:class I SAM-dependent methyltransferase [Spirochaetales bacterium]